MGSAPNSVFKSVIQYFGPCGHTEGGGLRPPPFVESFVDDATKLLGYEAIKRLGYEAIRLYDNMARNTELHT